MSDEIQVISTEERSYFALMPHIADDELDTYEYRLYGHYKRVCGEHNRPCREKTRTTAKHLNWSPGSIVQVRVRLEEKGYIRLHKTKRGTIERIDVTLTDLWPRNMLRYATVTPSDHTVTPSDHTVTPSDRTVTPSDRPKNNLYKNNLPKKNLMEEEPPPKGSVTNKKQEGAAHGQEEAFSSSIREDLLALSVAMLEACGLVTEISTQFAQTIPFETLREYVMEWRADKDAGVGALKYRIDNKWRVSPLLESDYNDPFYLEYRTPEEIARDEQAPIIEESGSPKGEHASPPIAPPLSRPLQPVSEELNLWQRTLEDLELGMPASAMRTLRTVTYITETETELFLSVPMRADTMMNRLQAKLQRELKRIAGRPIALQLVAATEVVHA